MDSIETCENRASKDLVCEKEKKKNSRIYIEKYIRNKKLYLIKEIHQKQLMSTKHKKGLENFKLY